VPKTNSLTRAIYTIRTGEQNNEALTAVNANEVQRAALRAADEE